MKTLKQIIEIVQDDYNNGDQSENGLCLVSFHLKCANVITDDEHKLFTEYLWDWAEKNLHELYFRNDNQPTIFVKFRGYMWKYSDRGARMTWMYHQLNVVL